MPGIEEDLRAALLADTAVAGLVGVRVYPGDPPANDTPPYVTFTADSEEPGEDLNDNDPHRSEYTFSSFAATYLEARDIKRAVRKVLNKYRGGLVRRCMWMEGEHTPVEGGHEFNDRFEVWGSDPVPIPITEGLLAVWRFDGDLTDSTGNGRHLTNVLGGNETYTEGLLNQAHDFHDTGALDSPAMDITEGTLCGWIKLGSFAFGPIFNVGLFHDEGSFGGYTVSVFGASGNVSAAGLGTPVNLTGAGWHHIALSFSATSGSRLWVDGTLAATSSTPVSVGTNQRVGFDHGNPGWPIDTFTLHDRVLTNENVAELYADGAGFDPSA